MEQTSKRLYSGFARWSLCSEKVGLNSERIASKRVVKQITFSKSSAKEMMNVMDYFKFNYKWVLLNRLIIISKITSISHISKLQRRFVLFIINFAIQGMPFMFISFFSLFLLASLWKMQASYLTLFNNTLLLN